jgi:hypothetical protein
MNNKLVCIFIISWIWPITLYAQSLFTESFQFEGNNLPEYVDQITAEYLKDSSQPVQQRLQQYLSYSELLQQPHDRDHQAIWYFIQGLNNLNIISILKQVQSESNIENQSEIEKYNHRLQQAFKSAMAADKNSHELSANMYAIMQRTFEGDLKIEAIQNELRLGGSGDSEASYWFKHWQVIGALKDAGRFNEAELALNKMNQELKSAGLQNSAYSQIPQHIVKGLSQARMQLHSQISKSKSEPVEKKHSKLEKFYRKYWPLVLINGILLGFIIITAFISLKKKN